MGYILEPEPNPLETNSAETGSTQLVKRLFKESIRPYLKWIIVSLICMAGVAAATATSAWIMKPVINEVFVAKNETLLFPISLAVTLTCFPFGSVKLEFEILPATRPHVAPSIGFS